MKQRSFPGFLWLGLLCLFSIAMARDENVITETISITDSFGSEFTTEFAVVLPHEYDDSQTYPLLVALHGYGGNAESFTKAWRGLTQNNDYILLCPQGTDGLGKDNSYGWDSRAEAVVTGTVDKVKHLYAVDEGRIYLTGFSQGAYLSYQIALNHPQTFKGCAPVASKFNVAEDSPMLEAAMSVGFYIIHGDKDRNVEQARATVESLRKAGIRTVYKEYEGLGHGFPRNRGTELQKVINFFNTL